MKLRAAREQSGKTQAQVAKEVGISAAQYQNIEYDKARQRADGNPHHTGAQHHGGRGLRDGNPADAAFQSTRP